MPHYPEDRKAAVLGKRLTPHNRPVLEIANTEGISDAMLYSWPRQARQQGVPACREVSTTPLKTAAAKPNSSFDIRAVDSSNLSLPSRTDLCDNRC